MSVLTGEMPQVQAAEVEEQEIPAAPRTISAPATGTILESMRIEDFRVDLIAKAREDALKNPAPTPRTPRIPTAIVHSAFEIESSQQR